MQNRTLIAVTIAVLAVAPIGAQARRFPDSYAGIGAGAFSYKVASVARLSAVEFSPRPLRCILGLDISEHMSLEYLFQMNPRGNATTKQDVIGGYDIVDVASGASLTRAWYLRGTTKLRENLEGFVRFGSASTDAVIIVTYETNTTYARRLFSYEYSSLSWGLGVSYALNKRLTVDIDYMSYLENEGEIVDEPHTFAGTTISLVYQL